ncbi:MAG: hypothetical protein ABSE77_08750 [Acidimicrobiales bacterium]
MTHRHVRRLVAERRVPFLRVGRFIRFDPAEIAQWLDNARRPAGSSNRSPRRGERTSGHRAFRSVQPNKVNGPGGGSRVVGVPIDHLDAAAGYHRGAHLVLRLVRHLGNRLARRRPIRSPS